MVTSIKDNLITTNIKVNWFGDFLGYWDFEIESPMYNDLVVLNKNPEAKNYALYSREVAGYAVIH